MSGNIQIFKLEDVYIFKKGTGSNFFYTTTDSFIVPRFNFSSILKFMLIRGLLSPKVLEGILEEYYNMINGGL